MHACTATIIAHHWDTMRIMVMAMAVARIGSQIFVVEIVPRTSASPLSCPAMLQSAGHFSLAALPHVLGSQVHIDI